MGETVFQTAQTRQEAMMQDLEGTFGFDSENPYPDQDVYAHSWYVRERVGDRAVSANLSDIKNAAEEFGVDQDLLEAVVYMENAHGWYDSAVSWAGLNSSSLPGNVNGEVWAELLGVDPSDVRSDATVNLRLSAAILAEIQERLVNPTPAAIATLYNNLAADQLTAYGLTVEEYLEEQPWEQCFVAGTLVQLASGAQIAIEAVQPGMQVACFDGRSEHGRGSIVAKPVVRLYENVTQEFIKLEFQDGRAAIHVTPGHSFLDEAGGFTRIGDLVRLGGGAVRIVDQSGVVVEAMATLIQYSEETAHMFERSDKRTTQIDGTVAIEQRVEEGWRTYNFEVAELHTYVAGGIRVHNKSGVLGQIGDSLDNNFFDKLGRVGDAVGDLVNGVFHGVGELVDAAGRAATAIGDGFRAGGDKFRDGDVLGGIAEIGKGIGNAVGEVISGIGAGLAELGRGISNAVGSIMGNKDSNDGAGNDNGKPIILDMDGDGIEIAVDGNVSFDMDNDGYLEKTHWVGADDAFLVIDLNADGSRGVGDGEIDQTKELVFTEWLDWDGATDLQALAIFDQSTQHGGNQDGFLSGADSVWNELKVWQDANSNGEVDTGELKTLTQVGISRINLAYDDGTAFADISNDADYYGSSLLGSASYWQNGAKKTGAVGDVSLTYEAQGSKQVDTSYGYRIDFESGATQKYVDVSGKSSPNGNLTSVGAIAGYGDQRANVLDATGSNVVVNLIGAAGNDTLRGGNKDDVLEGGAGADVIDGKGGKDTVIYSSSDAGVFVHLLNGTMTGGDAQGDVLSEIENVVGSDYADTINGTAIGNMLSGGSGDDKIYGLDGWDRIYLGDGNDVGTGGNGNDKIYGDAGNDKLFGGNNNDKLYGGAGNDKLFGEHGVDEISGGTGNDILRGGGYNDTLDGGFDDDILYGDTGSDRLIGGRGNDTLTGGTSGNYNDVFVFAAEDGQDIIKDFQDNRDKIEFDIDGLTFGQLQITNVTGGVRITYDEDDTITLDGLTASVLTESDFIF